MTLDAKTLASRIYFSIEEDVSHEFASNLATMFLGPSQIGFDTLCVIRDTETDYFYGFILLRYFISELLVDIHFRFAELDERLDIQEMSNIFSQGIFREAQNSYSENTRIIHSV